MISIKFKSNEHEFDNVAEAASFMIKRVDPSRHRSDMNEFEVTWEEEERTEVWTFMAAAADDLDSEFKISPHGSDGDFDTDCYWIEASGEVVEETLGDGMIL